MIEITLLSNQDEWSRLMDWESDHRARTYLQLIEK